MKAVRSIAVFLFVCLMAITVEACATLGALLPDVITYVTDGAQIIDVIVAFVDSYFAAHPDPAAQQQVASAVIKVRAALTLMIRAAQGAKAMDDANVDAAFAEFKAAYLELMVLVRPYGVVPTGIGKFQAAPGLLQVPEPLAFHPRKGGQ